jgi:hypothetical protein
MKNDWFLDLDYGSGKHPTVGSWANREDEK